MVFALMAHGDFLGMNVHEWHCNTEIKPKTKDYTVYHLFAKTQKMIRCKGLELQNTNYFFFVVYYIQNDW